MAEERCSYSATCGVMSRCSSLRQTWARRSRDLRTFDMALEQAQRGRPFALVASRDEQIDEQAVAILHQRVA